MMPERDGRPNPIELDIMRTFGWGVIALEETMFQRFLHISARHSLTTREEFRKHLYDMESKGFLLATNLHGKRAYRRQLVSDVDEMEVQPRVPLDEMRLVVGSLRAQQEDLKHGATRVTSKVISESKVVSEEILQELERCILAESGVQRRAIVHQHIENMVAALSESERSLFEYVRRELPLALECLGKLIRSRGPELLMLSLRLAEPQVRRYRMHQG
ncbi:MAG: hypothetical protein ACFFEF_08000 [Candidatus Thorarchaeota archaeon]